MVQPRKCSVTFMTLSLTAVNSATEGSAVPNPNCSHWSSSLRYWKFSMKEIDLLNIPYCRHMIGYNSLQLKQRMGSDFQRFCACTCYISVASRQCRLAVHVCYHPIVLGCFRWNSKILEKAETYLAYQKMRISPKHQSTSYSQDHWLDLSHWRCLGWPWQWLFLRPC